jgi:hypothetical protein
MLFDYIFIVLPFILAVYFAWKIWGGSKRKATREKEYTAAFLDAFNKWAENPCEETRAEMDRLTEERYGPGV